MTFSILPLSKSRRKLSCSKVCSLRKHPFLLPLRPTKCDVLEEKQKDLSILSYRIKPEKAFSLGNSVVARRLKVNLFLSFNSLCQNQRPPYLPLTEHCWYLQFFKPWKGECWIQEVVKCRSVTLTHFD